MIADAPTSTDSANGTAPFVLALDVGTSSVRALVYDAMGRAVRGLEAHRPCEVITTPGGGVVVDPDLLFDLICECLDAIVEGVRRVQVMISAVALDTFWHSLMGIAGRRAVTPVYTWADTRSADAAQELRGRLDAEAVHQRTGTELHSSYWPAKLVWLRSADPDTFCKVEYWISIAEYLYLCLFGDLRASVSIASGTGIFNQVTCQWDAEIVDALPLKSGQLSPLTEFSDAMTGLRTPFSLRWKELADIPWYLGIGDGAANNIGSGGTGADCAVLMVGTSGAIRVVRESVPEEIPAGLWSYRLDRRRIVQGGALSAGGNVYAWAVSTLSVYDAIHLQEEIDSMPPDSHGLTVLPFLAGERSPYWNVDARSALVGMTLNTRPADMVRALLESIAYRFALVYQILEDGIPTLRRVIGSGAGLMHSPSWTQIMSDVLARPIAMSAIPEASSRGSALLVLESLGAISDVSAFEAPMSTKFEPTREDFEVYRAAIARQQDLYRRLLR
jgi:gluconokinase